MKRLCFAALASLLAVGCSSVETIGAPRTSMTVKEAQREIVKSLGNLTFLESVRDVKCTRKKLTFKADYKFDKSQSYTFSVTFAELGTITIKMPPSTSSMTRHRVKSDDKPVFTGDTKGFSTFEDEASARTFVDCLLTLKNAASAPDSDADDFAAFSVAAKAWLAAETRPPMSDEARAAKALAEDAFKRKEFAQALDAYEEALEIYPMWPAGHYNAALLAAEVGDYEVAAEHMRRYLVLAPDAKDAEAAKDKYLLWQRKAKK